MRHCDWSQATDLELLTQKSASHGQSRKPLDSKTVRQGKQDDRFAFLFLELEGDLFHTEDDQSVVVRPALAHHFQNIGVCRFLSLGLLASWAKWSGQLASNQRIFVPFGQLQGVLGVLFDEACHFDFDLELLVQGHFVGVVDRNLEGQVSGVDFEGVRNPDFWEELELLAFEVDWNVAHVVAALLVVDGKDETEVDAFVENEFFQGRVRDFLDSFGVRLGWGLLWVYWEMV